MKNKLPRAVQAQIDDGETEEDTRQYILRSLAMFATIEQKATDEAGWIAFKLGCKIPQAKAAIRWATTKAGK